MTTTDDATDALDSVRDILERRSINGYTDVGPTEEELTAILQAAVTVPDHGGLQPWRLVVVEGEARAAFGDALAAAGLHANPSMDPAILDRLRSKAFVAPALVAVCARIDESAKVPEWEQVASAACAGYAITLAAHRLGLGAMWKSSPFVDGDALRTVLDMGPRDQFLGWVNLGRVPAERVIEPRPTVALDPIVRRLSPTGAPQPYR